MDGRFDPRLSSILIFGLVEGPSGRTRIRLAVDTGSTRTVIRSSILQYIGCDLTTNVGTVRMTSATGVQTALLTRVFSMEALGRRGGMTVVAHELPATFEGHGLLGRDFFDGRVLTINFRKGLVSLRLPRESWWQFWR